MTSPASRRIDDLPELEAFVTRSEWQRDIVAAGSALFGAAAGTRLVQVAPGTPLAFRYEDVRALSADARMGNIPAADLLARSAARTVTDTAAPAPDPERVLPGTAKFMRDQVFTDNPPLHRQSRHALARHLLPRTMNELKQVARALAIEVADTLTQSPSADLGHDFATVFATKFFAYLLDLDQDSERQVRDAVAGMNDMFLLERPLAVTLAVDRAAGLYMDAVATRLTRVARDGTNPIIAAMVGDLDRMDAPGRPTDVGMFAAANFFDGFHTVAVAITNVMYYLLSDRSTFDRVANEPDLAAAAFSEGTRLAPPVMITYRRALEAVVYDGVEIPAGTSVGLAWAVANRDPAAFTSPDTFDLARTGGVPTTFGGGAHLCPGRSAARMLVETAVLVLTSDRYRVVLDHEGGGTPWREGTIMRQLPALPIRCERTR